MSLNFFSKIILISFLLLANGVQAANSSCTTLNRSIHGSCSVLGEGYINSSDPKNCDNLGKEGLCCCPLSVTEKTSPKYILIASVTGFLGLLTIITLIAKKNAQ